MKHQIRVKISSGLLEHLVCTFKSCKSECVLWMRLLIMMKMKVEFNDEVVCFGFARYFCSNVRIFCKWNIFESTWKYCQTETLPRLFCVFWFSPGCLFSAFLRMLWSSPVTYKPPARSKKKKKTPNQISYRKQPKACLPNRELVHVISITCCMSLMSSMIC